MNSQHTQPQSLHSNAIDFLKDETSANVYLKGGLDTLDVLRAKLDPAGFEGYCIGKVHQRLHRAAAQPPHALLAKQRDWATALWYLNALLRAHPVSTGTTGTTGGIDELARDLHRHRPFDTNNTPLEGTSAGAAAAAYPRTQQNQAVLSTGGGVGGVGGGGGGPRPA